MNLFCRFYAFSDNSFANPFRYLWLMPKNKLRLFFFFKVTFGLIVSLYSCTSAKELGAGNSKHFTILEANFQAWHSGRQGGGSGTDYRFTAVINTSDAIGFEEVWIKEKAIALPLTPGRLKGPATNQPFSFAKGDTIALYASINSETKSQKADSPADLKGEAIISYSVKEKKAFKAVPALTQIHTDPRPQ